MKVPHSADCGAKRWHADMRDYCECGAREIQERLDQLEDERLAIQRLMADAETITIESTGQPYVMKIVQVWDLQDVLDGRLR